MPVNCGGVAARADRARSCSVTSAARSRARRRARDGFFVEAHGGTLFLDEIGELPLELQPHLLRVLETRRVRRVGGHTERTVDVRIVAATNQTEGLGTDNARLRADLYHRLAHVVLGLPPLRERIGDLRELVEAFLAEYAGEHGTKDVTAEGWDVLAHHLWPGNIRELRASIHRALVFGGAQLGPEDFFPRGLAGGASVRASTNPRLQTEELPGLSPYHAVLRSSMEQALHKHGTIRAAATAIGMPKSTFADKARAWNLEVRRKRRVGPKSSV